MRHAWFYEVWKYEEEDYYGDGESDPSCQACGSLEDLFWVRSGETDKDVLTLCKKCAKNAEEGVKKSGGIILSTVKHPSKR